MIIIILHTECEGSNNCTFKIYFKGTVIALFIFYHLLYLLSFIIFIIFYSFIFFKTIYFLLKTL